MPRRTVHYVAGLMEVETTLHHTSQLGHGRHLDFCTKEQPRRVKFEWSLLGTFNQPWAQWVFEPHFPVPTLKNHQPLINMLLLWTRSQYVAATSSIRATCISYSMWIDEIQSFLKGLGFSSTWIGDDVWLMPLPQMLYRASGSGKRCFNPHGTQRGQLNSRASRFHGAIQGWKPVGIDVWISGFTCISDKVVLLLNNRHH